MKSKAITFVLAALFLGICALTGSAQNRERYTISATAGGVNAVSGRVMVKRTGQAPELLTSQDDLQSGDVVNTGAGSQAEILLNPGTYLRLAEQSEFEMIDNSLDNLLVKLSRGSAIIEATGPGGLELHIPIITEQKRMTIVRAGIYRINVRPGVTELFVRKGRMAVGDSRDDVIKGGKKVIFSLGAQSIAKLEKTESDQFDDWSKLRGQTLARANERLSARTLNGYLANSSWTNFDARFGRMGLWTWSPTASCYTFLPFYYGWGSPYGSSYGLFAPSYGFYYPGANRGYNPTIVTNSPPSNGSPSGTPGGSSTGPTWSTVNGPVNSLPSSGPSMGAPAARPGSQAGPRDPDGGGRSINRIKDPN